MKTKSLLAIACAFLLTTSLSVAAQGDAFDAEQTYQATCFACHGTAAAHSPEVGDQIEWEIRLERAWIHSFKTRSPDSTASCRREAFV